MSKTIKPTDATNSVSVAEATARGKEVMGEAQAANVWSDAAREASAAARRNSVSGKEGRVQNANTCSHDNDYHRANDAGGRLDSDQAAAHYEHMAEVHEHVNGDYKPGDRQFDPAHAEAAVHLRAAAKALDSRRGN